MKWSKLIRPLLIILILLSLVLMWGIWTGPSQYDNQTGNEQKKSSSVVIKRQLSRVFGPSQIVLHHAGQARMTMKKEVLTSSNKVFNEIKLDKLEEPINFSSGDYQTELSQQDDKIEWLYFKSIPFGIMSNLFSNLQEEYLEKTFDRIYLTETNPSEINFYNTADKLLYTSEIEEIDQEQLLAAIHRQGVPYRFVEIREIGEKYIYLPINEIKLPCLTYMVEKQPNSLFIGRLFDDTSEVREKRSEQSVQYLDYISEIRINEETNILNYYRNRSSSKAMPLTKTLMLSFKELTLYESWSDEIHFFDYNKQTNEVTYRRYIDGFPVFSPIGYGATYLTVVEDGMSRLQVPMVVAQTPISDEKNPKTLQSGSDLLKGLAEKNYTLETIDDIKIGYTWTNNLESDRVITLDPNWYIYTEGSWINVQELDENGGD
ncbi:Two-component signal transduction system YycFG, regulatory protein YycH [Carnobacterium iners]|uniref:Two-component signal transduction system YycFG, regulatory protein YycH n=1 Tax=Carnobacterium iners TaxID=1073423 RepID=A0A1X7MRS8_9LACT|nr:two-component system activity regulator YycH [Carnobacterium iners]SEK74969.1 Two-component signal transduction system YycFG, regulatory protein YycH [Carnobacterium iners]SMH27405.1 Two-component signal transduction system YycFG, regulatory protein YycH [Carnobacterium iners]